MFQNLKDRFEVLITKVSEEADNTLEAAFSKLRPLTSFATGSDNESRAFEAALRNCQCVQEPSVHTVISAQEIFDNLFDGNNELNQRFIRDKLSQLHINENILLVEDKDHYNLLHKAIIYDSKPLLDLLIEHKFDVTRNIPRVHCNAGRKCSHYNLGALHLACYLNRKNIVEILIRAGADPRENARIYTSAPVNCPAYLQPTVLATSNNYYFDSVEIAAKCGNREPIFFAVLGDHLEIVKLFLENVITESPMTSSGYGQGLSHCLGSDGDSEDTGSFLSRHMSSLQGCESCMQKRKQSKASQYGYLLHLACRVGSTKCLKYLLDLFPGELNKTDADGMPPLLMVMKQKNGLYLTSMLIEAGADIHLLDDMCEKGNNVLHFLFTAIPWVTDLKLRSLSHVTQLCIKHGASINAWNQNWYLPIHRLLEQINSLPGQPINSTTSRAHFLTVMANRTKAILHDSPNFIQEFDDDLIKCIELLLDHGNSATVLDNSVWFLNAKHVIRYSIAVRAKQEGCEDLARALSERKYGLDNVLQVAKLMLTHCKKESDLQDYCFAICVRIIGYVLYADTSYVTWEYTCDLDHPYEILEDEAVITGYCNMLDVILPYCNKNYLNGLLQTKQLTPLLYLLSKVTDSHSIEGYIIPPKTAASLCRILKPLLDAGCVTEIELETRHGNPRMMGCFDMLMSILETMQEYQQDRTAFDLNSLRFLTVLLLQYGARTVVFRKLLYGVPGNQAEAPWCYCIPSHSFLYQFMEFGAFNLHYVNEGQHYEQLFHILVNQADSYIVQYVLNTVHAQFLTMHEPIGCNCGECSRFFDLMNMHLRECRSLKQLSRQAVRRSLQNFRPADIKQLYLPVSIQHYLIDYEQ